MCIRIYIYIQYIRTHLYIYTVIHIYTCICICMYIHIYAYTYNIHVYIYIKYKRGRKSSKRMCRNPKNFNGMRQNIKSSFQMTIKIRTNDNNDLSKVNQKNDTHICIDTQTRTRTHTSKHTNTHTQAHVHRNRQVRIYVVGIYRNKQRERRLDKVRKKQSDTHIHTYTPAYHNSVCTYMYISQLCIHIYV